MPKIVVAKIIQSDPDTPSISITENMILKITPKFVISTNFSNIPLPSMRIMEEIVSANKKPNDKAIRIVNNSISQPVFLIILESTRKPQHRKKRKRNQESLNLLLRLKRLIFENTSDFKSVSAL